MVRDVSKASGACVFNGLGDTCMLFVRFNRNWNVSTNFRKNPKYNQAVIAVFHADRRTGTLDESDSCFSQVFGQRALKVILRKESYCANFFFLKYVYVLFPLVTVRTEMQQSEKKWATCLKFEKCSLQLHVCLPAEVRIAHSK